MAKLKAKGEERCMVLVLDEAQTAFDRRGSKLAFQHMDGADIVTVSKTLGAARTTREPDTLHGGAITARCLELGLSMNIFNVEGPSAVAHRTALDGGPCQD